MLYLYQCKDRVCASEHGPEEIQKPLAEYDRPEQCSQCGGEMERIPTSAAVQFKGSGFYETDYKRRGK